MRELLSWADAATCIRVLYDDATESVRFQARTPDAYSRWLDVPPDKEIALQLVMFLAQQSRTHVPVRGDTFDLISKICDTLDVGSGEEVVRRSIHLFAKVTDGELVIHSGKKLVILG